MVNLLNSTSSKLTFGGSKKDQSLDTLLNLAVAEGGAVGEAAQSMLHPKTSILSTVGKGFKSTFRGFIEVISAPGQAVAGIISPDVTVREAVRENIRAADVIWGNPDPSNTTMRKVGDFFVRTATDILLDPLTYLTFGASRGIVGLASAPKVTLRGEAALKFGVDDFTARALSEEGIDVLSYARNIENQAKGTAKAMQIANKTEAHELIGKELDTLLKNTIDAPLGLDMSKKAMSNVLEKNPALLETLIDEGGIKFFGQSMLSGQRIRSVMTLIPGISHLDNFTQPIRGLTAGLFDPSVIKVNKQYTRLPQEFTQIEQAGKDLAASLGDDRLNKLANIVKANELNSNEAKFLVAAVEAGKLPRDGRIANAYKQLLDFNEEDFNFLKASGVQISRLDNHVPHILVETKLQNIPFSAKPKEKAGAALKRKLEGNVFKVDEPGFRSLETTLEGGDQKLIDEAFDSIRNDGFEIFDDNIVTALAKRSMDNVRVGTSRQFIQSTARAFGVTADKAPEGFVKIDTALFKEEGEKIARILGEEGQDILYHPAIAKKIEQFVGSVINDESITELGKAFDSIQNMWKASVTSIWPAFHGRNALSNVFLNFNDLALHSLSPALHAQSGSLIIADRRINRLQRLAMKPGTAGVEAQEELSELMMKDAFTDITGNKWTVGELRSVIKTNNVAFSKRFTGAVDIVEDQEAGVLALFQNERKTLDKVKGAVNPLDPGFKPFEVGREVGRAVEEQARLVNFLANLKDTGDVMHAAQRTKMFLFDYQNLTNFERTVMKRLMPFYTFTRKNLETQARTLFSTPGRSAAQITALENIGEVMSGGQLSKEEREALPEWMRDGINAIRSRDGKTVEILGSLGTPLEQPFQAFQPNALLSSLSPILRIPAELTTGYSFFQGKPLADVTNAVAFKSAPAFIKDYIGFTEVSGTRKDGSEFTYFAALRPDRLHLLLNLPPTSRVLSTLKQMQAVDVSTQGKLLQGIVGIRTFSVDLEREAEKRERETRKKLENLLEDAGVGFKLDKFIIKKD